MKRFDQVRQAGAEPVTSLLVGVFLCAAGLNQLPRIVCWSTNNQFIPLQSSIPMKFGGNNICLVKLILDIKKWDLGLPGQSTINQCQRNPEFQSDQVFQPSWMIKPATSFSRTAEEKNIVWSRTGVDAKVNSRLVQKGRKEGVMWSWKDKTMKDFLSWLYDEIMNWYSQRGEGWFTPDNYKDNEQRSVRVAWQW